MSILANPSESLAVGIEVTSDELIFSRADGRDLSVSIVWYQRLANRAPEQRQNWEIIRAGLCFQWPDVDEDLSVEGMLLAAPVPDVYPQASDWAVYLSAVGRLAWNWRASVNHLECSLIDYTTTQSTWQSIRRSRANEKA